MLRNHPQPAHILAKARFEGPVRIVAIVRLCGILSKSFRKTSNTAVPSGKVVKQLTPLREPFFT
jgi:hypothetical protein